MLTGSVLMIVVNTFELPEACKRKIYNLGNKNLVVICYPFLI